MIAVVIAVVRWRQLNIIIIMLLLQWTWAFIAGASTTHIYTFLLQTLSNYYPYRHLLNVNTLLCSFGVHTICLTVFFSFTFSRSPDGDNLFSGVEGWWNQHHQLRIAFTPGCHSCRQCEHKPTAKQCLFRESRCSDVKPKWRCQFQWSCVIDMYR